MKYFLLLLVSFSGASNVQAQSFNWAKQMGGDTLDRGTSIAIDDSGNVYTVGDFYHTVDFDPGPGIYNLTSAGHSDIFISKLDSSGNFVWAKQFGGSAYALDQYITLDHNGNLYITGSFYFGTEDFDPGPSVFEFTSSGGTDIYISKLDNSGNFVWAKQLTGNDWESPYALTIDDSENVYITGEFFDTVDFDPGPTIFNLIGNNTLGSAFISKLDPLGNFVWAKSIGSTSSSSPKFCYGNSIAVDPYGNVYITGAFSKTLDFDPGPSIHNLTSTSVSYAIYNSSYVLKLDASGNYIWAKQLGGLKSDLGLSMTVDNYGNVYSTGVFDSVADFDPGPGVYNLISASLPSPFSYSNIYISKLDSAGNFVWAKRIGGTYKSEATSIVRRNNNLWLTGYFNRNLPDTSTVYNVDFDPGPAVYNLSSTTSDAFICHLDTAGNFIWAGQMGGSGDDRGNSLALDGNGNIYTTGSFGSTADFDPGAGNYPLTSAGFSDIFISRLGQSDLVWPGDANYDLTANNIDILEIGLGYGLTGASRPTASLSWIGQFGYDWTDTLPDGANAKHSDCDGNGIVNDADTIAVSLNYGLYHLKQVHHSQNKGAGLPDLYFENGPFAAGDSIGIYVGGTSSPLTNAYGLAANVHVTGPAPLNTPWISFTPDSWMGVDADMLKFQKTIDITHIDFAVCRKVHTSATGGGPIGYLHLDPATPATDTFILYFSDVNIIDSAGQLITGYNLLDDTITFIPEKINDIQLVRDLAVVPNPSQQSAQLNFYLSQSAACQVMVTDISGKLIWQSSLQKEQGRQMIALPTNMEAGVYFVSLRAGDGRSLAVKWVKL